MWKYTYIYFETFDDKFSYEQNRYLPTSFCVYCKGIEFYSPKTSKLNENISVILRKIPLTSKVLKTGRTLKLMMDLLIFYRNEISRRFLLKVLLLKTYTKGSLKNLMSRTQATLQCQLPDDHYIDSFNY